MRTVNTKHDVASYESLSDYKREILYDANALYDAYLSAKRGSSWKPQVQKFEMHYLINLANMQEAIRNHTYEFLPSSDFVIKERGKTRVIHGEQMPDRTVKHALCDEVLNPDIEKYLIFDNAASQKGKGIAFTRRRLVYHLQRYYRTHGSNDGYILLIDYSKYYDNIRHDVLMDLFRKYIKDERALWLLQMTIDRSKVDVSYLDDDAYGNCMDMLFNSLEHEKMDKRLLTGDKMMGKHLNIGDQVAQTAGIAYPIPIDNYIKIVKGVKYYARYMDDSYVIHESKEYLQKLLKEIIQKAREIGITVNTKKTCIRKLSDRWRFLQIQYSLTDTGRIIQKINPKRLTTMRRKMKKAVWKMPDKEFDDWYRAWFRNHYKIMSKQQRKNMDELYNFLKGEKKRVHDQTGGRDNAESSGTERE